MRYASAESLTSNRSYMVMSTLILIVGLPLAWCLAAVSLPVLAGYLFDRTGGYGTPVLIAAALGATSGNS